MWRRRRQAAASRLTCVSSSPAAARVTPRPLSVPPLLALFALVCVQLARAQDAGTGPPPETGTITGVVTAQESGVPLPGAQVSVAGTSLGAIAGSDGRYTIALVPPGTYRMRARLIGHALVEMTDVVVLAGGTATANFQLASLA